MRKDVIWVIQNAFDILQKDFFRLAFYSKCISDWLSYMYEELAVCSAYGLYFQIFTVQLSLSHICNSFYSKLNNVWKKMKWIIWFFLDFFNIDNPQKYCKHLRNFEQVKLAENQPRNYLPYWVCTICRHFTTGKWKFCKFVKINEQKKTFCA